MTANVGRTVNKWVDFRVDDNVGTLRSIPIDSINGVGLDYDEVDLTAFQDAVKGALPSTPDCVIDITGPYDTSAAAANPSLSGSHTVLSAINGLSVPLTLGVFIGNRHVWEAGEQVFGLTSSATSGFLCFSYKVDVNAGKYAAKFKCFPGSSIPAFGTSAVT